MRLDIELPDGGCKMGPQAFREMVQDTFAEMFKGQITDEDLKNDPDEAIKFCLAVRKRARARNLPYRVILGTLTNNRKRGNGTALAS